ncbi:hypothetical protein [Chlorogloea sp. CCALA 695]|uniref:hypothetical protein n=1 Tax=Chlorogloea sp. CCALA 695 TaxID=2107693 RepID=UPI00351374E6
MRKMAARRHKTLVVCLECHHKIHYGRYDGKALSRPRLLESDVIRKRSCVV